MTTIPRDTMVLVITSPQQGAYQYMVLAASLKHSVMVQKIRQI